MEYVIVGALVVAAVWVWRRGSRPYLHRHIPAEKFAWLLTTLADHTRDGSLLFIEHEGSERFLQFAKRGSGSSARLEFGFPDAPWSREYFQDVQRALDAAGVRFAVSPTDSETTPRFLDVVIDENHAQEGARIAWIVCEAMGLGPRDRFCARFDAKLDARRAIAESITAIRESRAKAAKRR